MERTARSRIVWALPASFIALCLASTPASDSLAGENPAEAGSAVRTAAATSVAGPSVSVDLEALPALFERVSPAVVGLSCRRGRTETYFGTGTLVDPSGLVLTSTTVVPRDAEGIRAFLRGGKVHPCSLVLTEEALEFAVVRIDAAPPAGGFPFVELGHSSHMRLGEIALTLGNSFRSIEADDQVSLGFGVVSGFYALEPTLSQSKYSGPAIETSAPLNSGADGGPLIDGQGRMVGVLCLNYSKSRWLGTAVPIDALKKFLLPHLSRLDEDGQSIPTYLGAEIAQVGPGDLRIRAVRPDGPAAGAGLAAGDRILKVDGLQPESIPALREALSRRKIGAPIALRVARAEEELAFEVVPWGRF